MMLNKTLYLTPGGRYTEADIVANGKMTASQKFKGMKSTMIKNPRLAIVFARFLALKRIPTLFGSSTEIRTNSAGPPCVMSS